LRLTAIAFQTKSQVIKENAVTTRIFEMSDEAVESAQQPEVSFGDRLLCCVWVSVVSVIPALAAAYTAMQIATFFSSLTNAEDATASNVFAQLHILNTPMVIGLGVSAFLAFGFALAVAVEPRLRRASVALPLSIGITLLATMPALLLWTAETSAIAVLSGKLAQTTIASTAQTVSLLLLGTMASGMLVLGANVVFSIVSLCIPIGSRTDESSLRRPFVWGVTGVLLLVFAAAYFVVV